MAEYVHRELNGNASTTSPHNNVRYRGGSQTAATSGSHHHHSGGGISGSQPGGISGSTSTVSNNHPPGGGQLHQSPLVRPPIFTRLLSIVRGFLRSFGIRIWECLWLLPIPNVVAWFTLSSRPKSHRQQEHLEEEVGEEDPDEKSAAEIKGEKKPQPQVANLKYYLQIW